MPSQQPKSDQRDEAQRRGEPLQLDPERQARREAALREIRKFGDPALRTAARPVEEFGKSLRKEVERMKRIMHDSLGVGLAATQLGIINRVLVYRIDSEAPIAVLINPTVEWSAPESEPLEEGCLSLPGIVVEVERSVELRLSACDLEGAPLTIEASDLEARVIQHEVDHLNGVLILDRTSREERKEALRLLRETVATA